MKNLDMEYIEKNLGPARSLVRELAYYESLDSSNNKMKEFLGQEEGLLILVEEQTQGRGRRGRSWISKRSKGIYLSLLLKPKNKEALGLISLMAAAGLVQALDTWGISCQIKWPNDIVLAGRKLAGILTEISYDSQGQAQLILGLGLNVSMEMEDLASLEGRGTSLDLAGHRGLGREDIILVLLEKLARLYGQYEKGDYGEILALNRARSPLVGREAYLFQGGVREQVFVKDLGPRGELLVIRNNKEEALLAGELSIRGREGYI